MKKVAALLTIVILIGFVGIANATLWDRGVGLIYDDVLNITWMQNANYANFTSQWNTAISWADEFEYSDSVRNVIWDDWRLPKTLPINGTAYDDTLNFDGSTDVGFNITAPGSAYPGNTASELAYMFYNNLGNRGNFDVNGNFQLPTKNSSFESGGPNGPVVFFEGIQNYIWSANYYGPEEGSEAWYFVWAFGAQDHDSISKSYSAWLVRDGDVGLVPIPGALWLLGSGIIGLVSIRRKLQK